MSTSDSYAERGLYENQPPTPGKCITKKSQVAQNPLRGSYGGTDRVLREKSPGERLLEKPTSRKLAMEAMCWDCQGGSESSPPDPGWKWAIGNCTILACPLHNFRPYQNKAGKPGEGVYKECYGNGSED